MKIELWSLEKPNKNPLKDSIDEYSKRILHYAQFRQFSIDNSKLSKKGDMAFIKEKEAELLEKHLKSNDFLILLDERGKALNSLDFAEKLEHWWVSSPTRLVFLIGGSYGVHQSIKARAQQCIQLSKMTLPHRMVQLLISEQIYRAFTIIRGEKYHHK